MITREDFGLVRYEDYETKVDTERLIDRLLKERDEALKEAGDYHMVLEQTVREVFAHKTYDGCFRCEAARIMKGREGAGRTDTEKGRA